MTSAGVRGVFLDRDGVINHDSKDYIRTVEAFRYIDGTDAAFRALGELGLPVVIVTNQSALARGYTTQADVDAIHQKLRSDVEGWGGAIASVQFCPHHPDDRCRCRKPGPGMFEQAAAEVGIDLSSSYMVGDAPTDMQAGAQFGMTLLRVRTGRGLEGGGPPDVPMVDDLRAAVARIVELESTRNNSKESS